MLSNKIDKHLLQVNDKDIQRIEAATRLQSKSTSWFAEREWRLTASNFGTLCKITNRRNINKLCTSLLCPNIILTHPILHGRTYESLAIRQFTEISGYSVKPCGLFVSEGFPFLAATPDGLVGADSVVEVKCPYVGRNEKIAANKHFPFLMCEKGQLSLKPSHNYFDQVQGQMFITNCTKCFFIVYTFVDLQFFIVKFDEEYCQEALIPKLECFYEIKVPSGTVVVTLICKKILIKKT